MSVVWWALAANWLAALTFVMAICRAAAQGELMLVGG